MHFGLRRFSAAFVLAIQSRRARMKKKKAAEKRRTPSYTTSTCAIPNSHPCRFDETHSFPRFYLPLPAEPARRRNLGRSAVSAGAQAAPYRAGEHERPHHRGRGVRKV